MNETERLILKALQRILAHNLSTKFDDEVYEEINKALAPKEDDGLAEQRDKDLVEGSLNANKTEGVK